MAKDSKDSTSQWQWEFALKQLKSRQEALEYWEKVLKRPTVSKGVDAACRRHIADIEAQIAEIKAKYPGKL